jgi:hypothetical protein
MTRDLELAELLHPKLRPTLSAHEENVQVDDVLRFEQLLRPHPSDSSDDCRADEKYGEAEKDGYEDPHNLSKSRPRLP